MWLTALLLGFAGSFHCLGMCSPLAMAVTRMKPGARFNQLLYNMGRVLTYGVVGALVSSMGLALRFTAFQSVVSIVAGLLLILLGVAGIRGINIPVLTTALQKLSAELKSAFGRIIRQKTKTSIVVLGMLNGLLPCGLTYLALMYCLTLAGPLDGFNFMLLFGVGTLPAMLGFTVVLEAVIRRFQFNVSRFSRIMLVVAGCLLLVRVILLHPHSHDLSSKEANTEVICK